MAWPSESTDSANKQYVDHEVSTHITSSTSFIGLLDTPKIWNEGRILFEGTSSVEDSSNLTFSSGLLNVIGDIKASNNIYIGSNSKFFESSNHVIKTDDSLIVSQLFGLESTLAPIAVLENGIKLYYSSSGISPNKEIMFLTKTETNEEIIVLSRII
ncbi:hypothetical protein M0P65_07680 [Candidatus Gracilibacteria bacterium]|nr:hypothetical protein [Candidatus Gracilibacteria bacterium]